MDAAVPVAEAFRPEKGRFPHLVAWGRCDADGRFLVEDLPAGPFHVRASGIRDGEIRPEVPADTRDLGLALPFTATITGRVLEGATDAPVDDFMVVLMAGRLSFPEARPRAGPGRFRFEGCSWFKGSRFGRKPLP